MDSTGNEVRSYKASVRDVADQFGVHPNTVYNWLKGDNPPPHRRVGDQYRFNAREMDEWASNRSEEVA